MVGPCLLGPNGMGNNICLLASGNYKVISVGHDNLSIASGLTIFFYLLSNGLLLSRLTIDWVYDRVAYYRKAYD